MLCLAQCNTKNTPANLKEKLFHTHNIEANKPSEINETNTKKNILIHNIVSQIVSSVNTIV